MRHLRSFRAQVTIKESNTHSSTRCHAFHSPKHTTKMKRDGNDWMPPTSASPVDVTMIMLEPDLQSSGFPITKNPSLFGRRRRRRVRFASQPAEVAIIPTDYTLPLAREPPPRLTIRQVQERVEALTRQVCQERDVIHKEKELLYHVQQEFISQRHSREHIAQLKRHAIADLHMECQRLEENVIKMKSEMQRLKQEKMIERRRKRRHSYQDRRPRGVPGIWSSSTNRSRTEIMNSADPEAGGFHISSSSSRSSLVYSY